MRSVAVVGGGMAGTSAALEAARRGAEVTLFDGSEGGRPGRSRPPCEGDLASAGVAVLREAVASLGPGPLVVTSRRRVHPNSVIVATGSMPHYPRIAGMQKPGVHFLRTWKDLLPLTSRLPAVQLAVVWGECLGAMAAADKLRGSGREVTIIAKDPHWAGPLAESVVDVVLASAAEAGIRVTAEPPERVVGVDQAEAVIAGGRVLPCDAFILLPSTIPRLPKADLTVSNSGRLLVDCELRTSSPGVYGAGSCAELAVSGPFERLSPSGSGFISGANAAGSRLHYRSAGSWSATMFGLTLVLTGLSLREARRRGYDPVCTERSWGPRTACAVIFDSRSSKVLGVQLAGESASETSGAVPMLVADSLDLAGLASSDWSGSTDISHVSETARQGLRWRGP